eukprot:473718_1
MESARRLQFIVQTQHDVILIVMETMRVMMLQFIVQTLHEARCDIDCYGHRACDDATIYCPNSARCDIDCDGYYACHEATIHGSSSGNCDVHCDGDEACYDLSCSGGLTCTDDGEQICNENTMPVWIVFMILSGISACIVYFVLVRTAKVVRYETVVDDIEKEESIKRV